jgi:hypothetical protein
MLRMASLIPFYTSLRRTRGRERDRKRNRSTMDMHACDPNVFTLACKLLHRFTWKRKERNLQEETLQ